MLLILSNDEPSGLFTKPHVTCFLLSEYLSVRSK
nr:MAG TPA: hypothetical protein [Caudoviricetes sp.]